MKLLVAGYTQEETNRLSAELRAAGHQVLGAVGRHGARTFVKVVSPDLMVVPQGEQHEVRDWIADLAPDLAWVALAPGADPVAALAGGGAVGGPRPLGSAPPSEPRAPAQAGLIDVAVSAWERPPVAHPQGGAASSEVAAAIDLGAPRASGHAAAGGWEVEPPPLPPPALPNPARPPGAGASAAELPPPDADLASKLAQTRFGDYHSLLELEPDASPYAVREQYTRLSRLYSPRGWPRKLGPEDLETLQEVQSGIRDAYLILGEPELRARYERALLGTTSPSTSRRR